MKSNQLFLSSTDIIIYCYIELLLLLCKVTKHTSVKHFESFDHVLKLVKVNLCMFISLHGIYYKLHVVHVLLAIWLTFFNYQYYTN